MGGNLSSFIAEYKANSARLSERGWAWKVPMQPLSIYLRFQVTKRGAEMFGIVGGSLGSGCLLSFEVRTWKQ
jgi:hypothetical protein